MEHAIWTRSYIVSAIGGLEDQDKVLARLLRNQDEIGNAIKPYYGEVQVTSLENCYANTSFLQEK